MTKIDIYTDGSCRSNTGKGGWGAVIIEDDQIQKFSGSELHTTNNRMELLAAIKALEIVDTQTAIFSCVYDITVYTDSTYLSRGMTEWTKGWKKRGWKLCTGQPMKNADLWKRLDELACSPRFSIKWKWVKAHNGNKYNEIADGLAQEASQPSQ